MHEFKLRDGRKVRIEIYKMDAGKKYRIYVNNEIHSFGNWNPGMTYELVEKAVREWVEKNPVK